MQERHVKPSDFLLSVAWESKAAELGLLVSRRKRAGREGEKEDDYRSRTDRLRRKLKHKGVGGFLFSLKLGILGELGGG